MKPIAFAVLALLVQVSPVSASEINEIPKVCYDTVDAQQFCTTDNLGKVQVFVYNAGWCPPCNAEMGDLSKMYPEFANQEVVFASLSGEGYARGSKPDQTFLKSWKAKHKIPFVVAGKYKDFGKSFSAPGSIPFAVIVDKAGNVEQKGFVSANQIRSIVRKLLQQD